MTKGSLTGGGRLKAVVAMRQLTVSPFLCRWLWWKLELESDLAELDASVWYISSQFFEKQPDEIFQSFEWKRVKRQSFLRAREARKSHQRRKRIGENEKSRRKKGGEAKKAMVALLLFTMATLEIFDRKKLFVYFSQHNTCFFFNNFFLSGDLLLRNMLNRPARMKLAPAIPLTLKNSSLTW